MTLCHFVFSMVPFCQHEHFMWQMLWHCRMQRLCFALALCAKAVSLSGVLCLLKGSQREETGWPGNFRNVKCLCLQAFHVALIVKICTEKVPTTFWPWTWAQGTATLAHSFPVKPRKGLALDVFDTSATHAILFHVTDTEYSASDGITHCHISQCLHSVYMSNT